MAEHEKHDCGCCHCHEHEHGHEHGDCGCGCGHEHGGMGRGKLIRLCISFALLLCTVLLGFFGVNRYVCIVLYAAAYFTAGFDVFVSASKGILKHDIFGESFLMTVASSGAFIIGEYAEGCAVMLLFEFGEYLQGKAVEKSRRSIRKMLEMRPEKVVLIRDGNECEVKPHDVHIGDTVLVRAGDKIACDGVVCEGSAEVDMSSLTGESIPIFKAVGDSVLSGSISVDGVIYIRVTEEYDNSTVSKIIESLEKAKSKKSHTESFISRFARVYTPIVCAVSLFIALVPPLLSLGSFDTWIYRGLCTLAASCPCALVISVPLGFFGGLGAASRTGVLVKGANYLEALASADTVLFDKTGTLTSGSFTPCGEENVGDKDVFYTALAICERYSTHPIAAAINDMLGKYADGLNITDTAVIRGRGVRAVYNGDTYICGNAAMLREENIEFTEATLGGSAVYAAKNGSFLGSMSFADVPKSDSAEAVRSLYTLGITDTVMLTGDKREIAEKTAKEVGIKRFFAELLPGQKADELEKIKNGGRRTVFVGDGINDAPVLAMADVGVAMGGIGSAAAIEAADAVIMGDSLTKLPLAIRIARKTVKIVRQNIAFSLAVKAVIVALAAIGFANLWIAVFGDVGVCLLAVLNSLRIMKKIK